METDEVLEPVVEQETVIETPAETEVSVEEPVEEPVETVEETPVEPEPAPEPMQINTHGQWETLEHFMQQELEVGKTYRIAVKGHCQFSVSAEKPTAGIATNEITFTKQDGLNLWVKTGE